ncbi:MAG: rhomboid family intramembrane serine protease [Paludibacter sp.]|nr:rhomboid family intramembrane serine protease [Paludibacter sp.]
MNVFDNLKQTFRQGNALIRLIYINISVFVGLKLLLVILRLFNISGSYLLSYLAIPADLTQLLFRFWTPFTYMFLHEGVMHILFNMLALFWFGKLFLLFFSEKQLVGLYISGGLIAALFYVVAYNIFPYFSPQLPVSILLGASGSIMAIIVATSLQSPNMEIQLMLLGSVKLKYIAIVAVLTSLLGITSSNGGGELAHLGGALAGYLFVVSLRQGKDFTKGLNGILDTISNLFKPRKLHVKQNPNRPNRPMSDADYNANKARKIVAIDRILDKIKTSGYQSLSAEEKKQLFEQSNKK